MTHWLVFIPTALLKGTVATWCIFSGQWLAFLYGTNGLVALAFASINAYRRKDTDTSERALILPALYWLCSLAIPTGNADSPYLVGSFVFLLAIQMWSYIHLNTAYSLGVSTWTGKIRDTGPYRFIRHPQLTLDYAFHLVFVLGNLTTYNAATAVFYALAIVTIISLEENYLTQFHEYQEYRTRVRYRVCPRIW